MSAVDAEQRTRRRVFEEAVPLLAERGIDAGILAAAAERAGCSLDTARLFYPRDRDLVVALQERMANELEMRAADLPAATVAERFFAAMLLRFEHMRPYRAAFRSLMAALLDPQGEHGVLSRQTETIRSRIEAVFSTVVLGARDCPSDDALCQRLVRTLYALHLGLVLLWTQDPSDEARATIGVVELARDLLGMGVGMASMPMVGGLLQRVESTLSPWIAPAPDPAETELAAQLLRVVFRHRRLLAGSDDCQRTPCAQCLALHLPKARRFVAAQQPIHFVLPAFPAKSPSPTKVLGKRPDMAERIALAFLAGVCDEVAAIYSPGARVTICSDGRVFGDLVAVNDDDISRYGRDVDDLIDELGSDCIDTFSTDDLLDIADYDRMRRHIVEHYAEPLDVVKKRAHDLPHHRAMWNGMQRFLFEDRVAIEASKSRTQVRKMCGELAHQVIRRSNAWTRVVAECFPTALRLSIHPQPAHSDKIGIRLGEHDDIWLTPWHGVAVEQAGRFVLMKREEAEALGGRVVDRDGRPSHFVIEP